MSTTTTIKLPTMTPAQEATAAFEREKAAITSYEEGWDRWDGPVWPVGYVQCRMQEDGYRSVPPTPSEEDGAAKKLE
ncbi:hypothetical protein N0V83_007930 [Neocucurbitaria cava]|uniref:Uncharacterized protein n=1 Tax=Neocucurbitaria cava TaxID=798079 RepID=A0A9W8Y2Y3_9PLEO|nr:hypothetical protein N0V83_007930 [Neocucurbitaria cava]